MRKMLWIKTEPTNSTVMDYYQKIIGQSFSECGYETAYKDYIADIKPQKGDIAFAATATSALKLYPQCSRLIYWAQGIWPEECYMRHESKLLYWIASILEKWALRKSEFVFFVSKAMREFYEKKYSLSFEGRCYIMPCANEVLHPQSFQEPGKYDGNVFCYAGSISVWQCFEETVALYRKIEERYPDAKLLLLVRDREKALEYIEKYGVQNYEIDFVPVEQLPEKLKTVKFGFVLRQPHPVNEVATPTKLLTYLANGLIPVYSDCLKGMEEILAATKYAAPYANDGATGKIEMLMKESVFYQDVLKEFAGIYEEYYDIEKHVQRIAKTLRKIL